MARISFGSLLRNPLVIGVLATEMTSNLARSYTEAGNAQRAQEQEQGKELETIGEAGGAMPTGTNRGLFGKLVAKTGLIPEQAPLTPYESAAYQVGTQTRQVQLTEQQRKQRLVDIAEEKARATKPTPTTETTIFGPSGQTKKVPITKGEEYTPPTGWSLKAPEKPEKSLERITEESAARAKGADVGKLNSSILTSPNPYYDTNTGNPVTTDMTRAEARKTGHMIPASPKAIQSYQDAHTVVKELDRLDEIAQRRLPSTQGMSKDQALKTIGTSWVTLTSLTKLVNLDNEANDLVYAGQLPAITLIHQIQQRYPSTIELNKIEPLIPGKTDSRESFHAKVVQLKSYLSSGINQGAREDAGVIEKGDAMSTYNAIVGGSDE